MAYKHSNYERVRSLHNFHPIHESRGCHLSYPHRLLRQILLQVHNRHMMLGIQFSKALTYHHVYATYGRLAQAKMLSCSIGSYGHPEQFADQLFVDLL